MWHHHITPILKSLHFLNIPVRINFQNDNVTLQLLAILLVQISSHAHYSQFRQLSQFYLVVILSVFLDPLLQLISSSPQRTISNTAPHHLNNVYQLNSALHGSSTIIANNPTSSASGCSVYHLLSFLCLNLKAHLFWNSDAGSSIPSISPPNLYPPLKATLLSMSSWKLVSDHLWRSEE